MSISTSRVALVVLRGFGNSIRYVLRWADYVMTWTYKTGNDGGK